MELLETFIVECPGDETGARLTKTIVEDSIADLALGSVFKRIRVFVDTREPVFIFAALIRTMVPPVMIKDMSKVTLGEFGKNEIIINVTNETYLTKMLTHLWGRYGKENLAQPERGKVVVKTQNVMREVDVIPEIVVDEPQRELKDKLVDAVALRILPEAFRVRKYELSDSHILFVSSENTLRQEWLDRGKNMLDMLRTGEPEKRIIF